MIGTEAYDIWVITEDRIIEVVDSEKISGETIHKIVEKGIEMREIAVAVEVEIEIGQEREPLPEIIEGIEALTAIDLDQGPEQVQIGIGEDAMCVESMITLLGIVLILERKEI